MGGMPQDTSGVDAVRAAGVAERSETEKQILRIEKKLREIEKLLGRKSSGETLDTLQEQKLSKEPELRAALDGLREQRDRETASTDSRTMQQRGLETVEDGTKARGHAASASPEFAKS